MTEISSKFSKDYLKLKNPFPGEENIVFIEEGHEYECYNPFFDKWIKKSQFDAEVGIDLESTTGLFKTMFHDGWAERARIKFYKERHIFMNDPTHPLHGCKTPEDVQDRNGSGAREAGNRMHEVYEIYCNLYQQAVDQDGNFERANEFMQYIHDYYERKFLMPMIRRFKIDKGVLEFYRTEAKMYDPVLNISGTIDMLLRNPETGDIVIVDHKRSSYALKPDTKHRKYNYRNYGFFLDTWKKIPNNSFRKYSLQLHVYRYILEQNYGMNVTDLALAVYDPKKRGTASEYTVKFIPMDDIHRKAVMEYMRTRANCILQRRDKLPPKLVEQLDIRANLF